MKKKRQTPIFGNDTNLNGMTTPRQYTCLFLCFIRGPVVSRSTTFVEKKLNLKKQTCLFAVSSKLQHCRARHLDNHVSTSINREQSFLQTFMSSLLKFRKSITQICKHLYSNRSQGSLRTNCTLSVHNVGLTGHKYKRQNN